MPQVPGEARWEVVVMVNIEDVIAKVQKLLRLSRSDNVHEAAAAAAAADRIMQEHGLQSAQFEAEGTEEREEPVDDSTPLAQWARRPTWQQQLASGLTRHYGCAGYLLWVYDADHRRELAYKMVGRPSDIAMVRYMWGWLTVEIERLAQTSSRGQGKAYFDSFRRGAVNGVLGKLNESKEAQRAEAKAKAEVIQAIDPNAKGVSALAIYDRRKDEAKAVLHNLYPEIAKREKRSRGGSSYSGPSRYDAYEQGKRAGANIHTGAAIGGGATKGRLT